MAIEFQCPDCHKTLRAPEEKSGIFTACPNCGAPVRVPHSQKEQYRDRSPRQDDRQATFDDEPDARDYYRERNQREKRFRRREMSQPVSGFALTSLITGIISLMLTFTCCFWFLGIPFSITAVITGLISKRKEEEASSMAMTGRICGTVAGLIQLAVTTYYIVIIAGGPNNF